MSRPGSTRSAGPPSTGFRSRSSTTRPRASGTLRLPGLARDPAAHRDRHLAALPHLAHRASRPSSASSPDSTAWAARGTPRSPRTSSPRTCRVPASGGLLERAQDVIGRRRPQVPARLEPAAQRDGESRLRPGRGRSLGAQPQRVRDLLRRAAAVLRGGKGLFTFTVNCVVVVDCNTGEGLFYSRRIGRVAAAGRRVRRRDARPRRPGSSARPRSPGACPAASPSACSTRSPTRSTGPGGTTLEPTTNYAVVRGNQDFRSGTGSVGFIVTAVNRSLDAASAPYLHRSAYTGGVDGALAVQRALRGVGLVRPEPGGRRYRGDRADAAGSRCTSTSAPTAPLDVRLHPDLARAAPTRSSGSPRSGGRRLHFETAYQRRTPGFEINDIGFLRQADQQAWTSWANLAFTRAQPRSSSSCGGTSTTGSTGPPRGFPPSGPSIPTCTPSSPTAGGCTSGGTLGQLGATYCDRCARGGPAMRQDPYLSPWITIEGDDRRPLVPIALGQLQPGRPGPLGDDRRGAGARPQGLDPVHHLAQLDVQPQPERPPVLRHLHRPERASCTTPSPISSRSTLSLTWRLGYTFTPTTSLQVYASPFVSKGTYSDVREIADARADDVRRLATSPTPIRPWPAIRAGSISSSSGPTWCSGGSTGPGSTLFLVWSQGREGSRRRRRARSRSAGTWATCSAGGRTTRSW